MKICPKCQSQVNDNAEFCTACGSRLDNPINQQNAQYQVPPQQQAQPFVTYDPYEHTAEFDAKDISDNKVIAMLLYLMGWIGIVIALLAANQSPYVAFHLRQALKFTVIETLTYIVIALTFWLILPAIAGSVFILVLFVVRIICFFQICGGKAKEPYIIRNFTFLK